MRILFSYILFITFLFLNCPNSFGQQITVLSDSSAGNYYFEKAEHFYERGEYDSSTYYYKQAANEFKSQKRWKDYLISKNYAGINLRYLSMYDESFNTLNEALSIGLEQLGSNEPILADIYNSIGSYYYETGELDSALVYYRNGLNLSLSAFGENHKNTARGYHNVGLIYYWQMDSDKALQYFEKSLYIWLSLIGEKHSAVGNCYLNIANAYYLMEDFDKAIQYALKSLNVWKSVLGEDHQYVAMAYNNLADTYETIGKYNEAIETDKIGLDLRKKIFGNEHIETANSLAHIASIYTKTGEFEKSRQYFNEAFAIYKKYPNSNPYKLQALLDLADLNLREGRYEEALKNCDTVLIYTLPEVLNTDFNVDNLTLTPMRTELLNAIFLKGEIYSKYQSNQLLHPDKKYIQIDHNSLKSSYFWYKRYNQVLEKIKREYRNETSKLFLGKKKFEVIEKLIGISLELYELTGDEKYKSEAFAFSEQSKAQSLYEAITESNAKQFAGIDEQYLQLEKSIKTKKTFLETKILEFEAEQPDSDEMLLMKKELFALSSKYDSLINFFETNYPEYYRLKFDDNTPDIKLVQKDVLDDQTVLLEYFIGDSLAYIFIVDKNQNAVLKTTCSEIYDYTKKFRASLQNLDYETYLHSAYKLYSILMKPAENFLSDKKRIIIIPDGITLYLPFEALLYKKISVTNNLDFKTLPYLLNQYEFVYSYSIKLLLNRKSDSNNIKLSFAGFAPVFIDENIDKLKIQQVIDSTLFLSERSNKGQEDDYSALPESDTEITEISKLFNSKGYKSKIFKYKNATETNLKSDEITSYSCVHLATHGFINESKPRLSGLIMSIDSKAQEDGILYSEEVFNLKLNAKLIVLSACESGLGTIINGEGILGLTRGFLYSGAENIIVSLWRVADKSTSVLMLKFYEKLLEGKSYTSALREAKLEILKDGTYSYPLEWSPFILIGK
ncbi:CHAT domain-containing tetratricopeptide repeat protein [Ignavibacterium sp.]|uniref:CHAT domain-containing protein n=1 Tax=Ignavibacterium sp. TaxID=2651167 RepID=UPI002208141F|nr:CHAT domain-containing tetratricopeptide repeat protein [Ignavibacterium sp.]BDQ03340.1 MAG: tetratricopeptide repeat domain protein [Ignavibacterium sp.]